MEIYEIRKELIETLLMLIKWFIIYVLNLIKCLYFGGFLKTILRVNL